MCLKIIFAAVIILFAAAGTLAAAEPRLPSIFADGMVLQRGMPVPIWGRGEAGERVTVEIAGQSATATADSSGDWKVVLPPLEAGGPFEMTLTAGEVIVLKNILVGDVWLASGQSNMAMTVSRVKDAEKEAASARFPRIRLATVPEATAVEPQFDNNATWAECTPQTVRTFSAVAYFFAREIHNTQDVPIGIIDCSWSGSVAEAWISADALAREEELAPLFERWAAKIAEQGAPAGESGSGTDLRLNMHHPSNLYNAMIAPLIPFAIRGVIWYQGEGNSGRANQYRLLFPMLIRNWRDKWGQGDFPFFFVQLANFRQVRPEPAESNWAELREVQTQALALPNTGMAVTVDVGEADDVHPKDKQTVGHRLALLARAKVYGERIAYSGPLYESMEVEDGAIRLHFLHVDGGLVSSDLKPLRCFSIASAQGPFVWADAQIEGDTVVVSSPDVPDPAAVRYAWQDNPGEVNFYNAAGLPASPFRTDDRPRTTTVELWPAILD